MQPYLFFILQDRFISRLENDDFRTAHIVCTLANINRDRKRRKKPYEIQEFMPDRRGKKKQQAREPQSWEKMLALAKMFHVALGGDAKQLPKNPKPKKAEGDD